MAVDVRRTGNFTIMSRTKSTALSGWFGSSPGLPLVRPWRWLLQRLGCRCSLALLTLTEDSLPPGSTSTKSLGSWNHRFPLKWYSHLLVIVGVSIS